MIALLVALSLLLSIAGMSVGAMVCPKRRVLAAAVAVATGTLGPFPAAFSAAPLVAHAGDMQGTFIGSIEVVTASLTGTSITATFEHSHDGTSWTTWFTGSAITTSTTTRYFAEDDFECPKRFVRVTFTNAGSGAATVTVTLHYAQVSARGSYAPPGIPDRY
jgi:hypothetical protein